jgi:hypothetical protein
MSSIFIRVHCNLKSDNAVVRTAESKTTKARMAGRKLDGGKGTKMAGWELSWRERCLSSDVGTKCVDEGCLAPYKPMKMAGRELSWRERCVSLLILAQSVQKKVI